MSRSIPEALYNIYGSDVTIVEQTPVYGGDINESCLLFLSNGERVFIKKNSGKPADFFAAEADGLRAMESTGTIGTAHVLDTGRDGDSLFLILEYIEKGHKPPGFFESFGRQLAEMHRADTAAYVSGGQFGFLSDNYIGATRQINSPCDTWIEFFRTRRLEVQFRMAWEYFDEPDRSRVGVLLDRLEDLLVEPEHPSLVHGDLWGGNYMVGVNGEPILIDPAVYVGHAEVDIAMTELFGGFSPGFYDAYKAGNPFESGYSDRRELYNLYHMLNHLNLFGGAYLGGVLRTVRRYAG